MKNVSAKTCKIVRLVYGWVFSAFTFVVGLLFIWQVLDIYLGGKAQGLESPYSYELVSSRLKSVIAVPFWIWIATIVIGFVLWQLFPMPEKLKPITDERYVAYRLQKRLPSEVGEDLKGSFECVKSQQRLTKILHWCLLGIVALYLIFVIVYVSIPSNFPNKNKTHEMLNAAKWLLPFALAVYAAGCAYVIILKRSAKKMLPHLKQLTKGISTPQAVQTNKFISIIKHKYFKLGVRIAVACIGVAFVIAGCFNGSVREVFYKAIAICTECIGLG